MTWPYIVCHITAETEAEEEALKDRMAQQYKTLQAGNAQRQQQQRKKSKGGIRRLFGRQVFVFMMQWILVSGRASSTSHGLLHSNQAL